MLIDIFDRTAREENNQQKELIQDNLLLIQNLGKFEYISEGNLTDPAFSPKFFSKIIENLKKVKTNSKLRKPH